MLRKNTIYLLRLKLQFKTLGWTNAGRFNLKFLECNFLKFQRTTEEFLNSDVCVRQAWILWTKQSYQTWISFELYKLSCLQQRFCQQMVKQLRKGCQKTSASITVCFDLECDINSKPVVNWILKSRNNWQITEVFTSINNLKMQ